MPESNLDSTEFVVVDLETTGSASARGDRVTEAAAVLVSRRRVELVFHSLIDPQQAIPSYITRLTGIDDAMVAGAPTFAQVAGELAAHLAGRVFVAHNAAFDWRFLEDEFGRLSQRQSQRLSPDGIGSLVPARLCTVRLARRFLRHLPRRNLGAVCAYYGIEIEGRHRAAGDALATAQVLIRLIDEAERSGFHTVESLSSYTRPRTRRSALPAWSDGGEGA